MKRITTAAFLFLSICTTLHAQTTQKTPADEYSFDLTPVPPPVPALKYQLLFDDLVDRRPGNAAILYFDAVLLMGEENYDKTAKAEDALDAGDLKTFATLVDSLDTSATFDELDLAARRDHCDWDPPFREMGMRTLLPHLNSLRRLATIIKIRATRQIQQGNIDQALNTLRLGYEMSGKITREVDFISGLVSVGITAYLNDALAQLMNHPDSPNLYWALAELPSPLTAYRMDNQRLGDMTSSLPALVRAHAGEELSADQWRSTLTYVASLPNADRAISKNLNPIHDASPDLLLHAREDYARTRHLTPEQASKIDPATLLGVYYFTQYEIAYDGFYKLRNFPYPLMRLMHQQADHITQLIATQPANPFLVRLPYADRIAETCARVARQHAALTAVEALRSYASTHAGSLPPSLTDLTETPAPPDPMTGHPFDYTLTQTTATLSAPDPSYPLLYTIKIRK